LENYIIMNIDPDNLEEVKELLEYAIDCRSWATAEDALAILREELGYEIGTDEETE
jgi:hypothetical protein